MRSRTLLINIFLLLSLILFSLGSAVSYMQVHSLLDANSWVVHTYQIIAKARRTLIDILHADLKARNFILTNNAEDLDIMGEKLTEADGLITQLMSDTSDNPTQKPNMAVLQRLFDDKKDQLNNIIAIDQSQGELAANAVMHTGLGVQLSEKLVDMINNRIVIEELRLLDLRLYKFNEDAKATMQKLVVASIMSGILLLLCFLLINYHLVQRHRAERGRKELENHLKKIIDGSTDLIAAVDLKGNYIAFNSAYERKYRRVFNKKIDLGMNIQDTLGGSFQNQEILNAWQMAIRGQEVTIVNRWRAQDESYYEINFNPIHDMDGKVVGAMHVMRDITARMKVDQLKNEFVSIVSHELRTPLTSIRGSLGLLAGGAIGKFDEKTQKMLTIAYNNSERLIRLINDILDIEKIETGKIDFHLAPINLSTVVRESIVANQPYSEKFDVVYKLLANDESLFVNADYGRLMQVLTNLLSNAAKFSPAGSEVEVSIIKIDDFARVSIVDKGDGIPEEFQKVIFQKFAQADPSNIRKQGGTGLGLSISKAIMEKFHGRLEFVTEENVGTTFYFDIPLWHEAGADKAIKLEPLVVEPSIVRTQAEKKSKKFLSVLYVEDDLDLTQIVSDVLRDEADLITVQTTQQALEIIATRKLDMILLDLVLPDGYGADLIPQAAKKGIPIVIFSAYELPQKFVPFVAHTLVKSKTTNQELIHAIREMKPRVTDEDDA